MKTYKVWCVCLLAWIVGIWGMASAEENFDALCKAASLESAEVIAWLEIPGADFCEPVMQHPGEDTYYSTHNAEGKETETGALFTQAAYNSRDFSDPVTLVYGSSVREDENFGRLQELYSGSFEACQSILLHLPDGTREYTAFAAIPYSSAHILHYYDFSASSRFINFFEGVFSTRALGAHLVEELKPEPGDQVLILSTGLRGDRMQRYLVMANLKEN